MSAQPVDVAFTWPTARPPLRAPSHLSVIQTEYRHEMLVLHYTWQPHTEQRFKEGTPLTMTWGQRHRTDTFFGQVLYMRPNLSEGRHTLRVVCIGTSYPMKDSSPSAHHDISVEQVVTREVRKQRFALVVEQPGIKWPLITRHAHESGWEFLIRLARRAGYTWYVNKATAYCFDPVKMLAAQANALPVLRYQQGGNIISFTPVLGDQGIPHQEKRERRLLTVDPRSKEIIGASSSGRTFTSLAEVKAAPKFADYLDEPAHSVAEALARVDGAEQDHRWTQRARVEIRGDALIHQGTGVVIEGVSKESDGVWYVHGVEHNLDKEARPLWNYTATLHLVRDGRSRNYVLRGPRRPLRREVSQGGSARNPRAPRPVWTGSQWVADNPWQVVLP